MARTGVLSQNDLPANKVSNTVKITNPSLAGRAPGRAILQRDDMHTKQSFVHSKKNAAQCQIEPIIA
jgi:hypothetical protein